MKKNVWYLAIAVVLLVLSASLYLMHFAIFRDAHHIWIYLLGDLAFLPLNVLLVTFVIDRLLVERERRASLKKQNMVIGAFFSEVGTKLARQLTELDPDADRKRAAVSAARYSGDDFGMLKRELSDMEFEAHAAPGDFERLKGLLTGKRDFMVRLLENPFLLEYESFTDMLWAVFHLTEELEARAGFEGLPASDTAHLDNDASRAYERVVAQWLGYMSHLKKSYPYLYSLALRLNPFDPEPSVLVA